MARPPMRPRSFKADDDLWDASLKAAEILHTDVSTEIRASLRALVKRAARATHPDARPATHTDTEETQP
jgi:hypothetical protein